MKKLMNKKNLIGNKLINNNKSYNELYIKTKDLNLSYPEKNMFVKNTTLEK